MIESLQEYVLIAQDRYHIERFTRQENQLWLLSEAVGATASLSISGLNLVLRLQDVYEQVVIPAEALPLPPR
jgi:hypothetical protein